MASSSFQEETRRSIPADVHMISGSMDSQTSSDVFHVGAFQLPDPAGKAGGACTSALLQVLYQQDAASYTWASLLQQMRQVLKDMKYDQIPQVTSSRLITVNAPCYIVPPPARSGTKRAVLIGINYVGQDGELQGCHNDVLNMKKYLEEKQGFEQFTVLMDDGKHTQPTRKNILDAFQRVAEQSKSGDVVFVHYSGHGGRLREDDGRALTGFTKMFPHQIKRDTGDEDDGYDETLIPSDFQTTGQIRDDDVLRVLVSPLKEGVNMTCVMDSCHSGTVLDLPYRFVATGNQMYRNDRFNKRKYRSHIFSFWLNIFNLLAYIVNAAVTYTVGALGLFGAATNAELSAKYQTLITPVGWSFSIWAVIFIVQLMWAIVQLVPAFRRSALVQSVSWYYIGVCLAQVGWTMAFSFEIIWLSLAAMLLILVFLVLIVRAQYFAQTTTSCRDYWLLKFPFSIHTGWILAASFVNLNVLFVDLERGADTLYHAALASLLVILLIAGFVLVYPTRKALTIPFVLVWATAGIYVELKNPSQSIVNTFDSFRISLVQTSALAVCGLVFVATIITAAIALYRRRQARTIGGGEEGFYQNLVEV